MWFNSFSYLWFLPTVYVTYLLISSWKGRKLLLLVASYGFYAMWNPPFVLLLLFSSLVDFSVGRALVRVEAPGWRKLLLATSCAINFGILGTFKYAGFLLASYNDLLISLGAPPHAAPAASWFSTIVLPVGISFYTFHGVSYIVDVYRRKFEPVESLVDFLVFVAFFPQLVAGPILRATQFLPQLMTRRVLGVDDFLKGCYLIILGLFQKVAMADNIAPLANLVYGTPDQFNTAELWIGTYAFAFQIYFDFAGYSNIAIGSARILGFSIPENFRLPYIAIGFREFWRRWHISLSSWLRDYLYIPLGGSRRSTLITFRNLVIVMGLGGLWHGANWTFVVWGLIHALYLSVEHLIAPFFEKRSEGFRESILVRIVGAGVTFHLACVAWVFFRAKNIGEASSILAGMMLPNGFALRMPDTTLVYLPLCGLALLSACFIRVVRERHEIPEWSWGVSAAMMLFLTIVTWGDASEFIYFQF